MIKIRIQDPIYEVPASWDEMTKEQLVFLIKLSFRSEVSYVEMQLKFFLFCIKATVRENVGFGLFMIKTSQGRHALFADELTAVLTTFDYLFDVNDNNIYQLSPKLTINHFKRVRCRCKYLHGPGDALENITYEQFVWLQTWQSQLNANPDAVNQFINVIYATQSDKRSLSSVRRMSKIAKTGILWYFQGTMSFLHQQFPHVFTSGDDNKKTNVFDYQQRIIDSLAEGDVTKKKQVRQSLLYDALYSMEMAAIRLEDMEKEHRKRSKK